VKYSNHDEPDNMEPTMTTERKHGEGNLFSRPTLKNWYLSFYRDGQQHVVNTKISKIGANEEETTANRKLAEKRLDEEIAKIKLGLKSDAIGLNKLKYETLRDHLIQKFIDNKKASVYTTKAGVHKLVGGSELDDYFAAMTLDKMAKRLPAYPSWFREQATERRASRIEKEISFLMRVKNQSRKDAEKKAEDVADAAINASINRSLSTLRSMYSRYSKDFPNQMARGDIPYMPRIEAKISDNIGQGFVKQEVYEKIKTALPERLRPIIEFMYITGMRSGAVQQLRWHMLEWQQIGRKKVATEIVVPEGLMKNGEKWSIPLEGALEPLRELFVHGLHAVDEPLFESTNLRRVWNQVCADLGLGVLDAKTKRYHGLHPHDLRRSAARNLVDAGVPQADAMQVTGHKSARMFERYNIKDKARKVNALQKVREYNEAQTALSRG
jgi:integrase